MNSCGLAVTDRMPTHIHTIVLGSLLAFGATSASAQSKSPEAKPATDPAAIQPPAPIDLSLPAAPINLTLPPVSTQQMAAPFAPLPAPTQQAASTVTPPPAPTQQAAPTVAQPLAAPASPPNPIELAVNTATASPEVTKVVNWVIGSKDNAGLPFLLIDKVNAKVFVFTPAGQLQGAAPALLGMARGDRLLAPNEAKMSQMPPQVRITPAGRFVSRLAIDSHGKELLVLDYDASISLHAVVKGTPKERRAERLSSATAQDNRISFGCINVPVPFYTTVVSPAFTRTKGIVYVLPETGTASDLFGMQPVGVSVTGAPPGSPTLDAAQTVSAPHAN